MKSVLILALIAICQLSMAQGFIQPLEDENTGLIMDQPAIAELKNGEIVEGRLVFAVYNNGHLNKLTLKKDDKTKVRLDPVEVMRLTVRPGGIARMALISDASESLKTFLRADFNEIITREYIIFESALLNRKKNKPRLMQLLNPGFDNKIKVFADPNANETGTLSLGGVQLTGGEDLSYLFLTSGEKVVKVKRGNYRKNFNELFGSCRELIDNLGSEKVRWRDVAAHVFMHNKSCE